MIYGKRCSNGYVFYPTHVDGSKPVVYPQKPKMAGYVAVADGWEETETEIIQKWKLVTIPITQHDEELAAVIADAETMANDLI